MYTTVKNLQWANIEHTQINCEVNFDSLPEEFVKFTADPHDKEAHSREIFNRSVNGEFGLIEEYIPPYTDEELFEMAKINKKHEINNAAGNARAKYITAIPGQESTYQFKLQEATSYVNTQNPSDDDFPFLSAEALATHTTVSVIANNILQTWNAWKPLAVEIEAIRRGALVDVSSATTLEEILNINPVFP